MTFDQRILSWILSNFWLLPTWGIEYYILWSYDDDDGKTEADKDDDDENNDNNSK